MRARRLWPAGALALIRRTRAFVAPNPGFLEQLELYHRVQCAAALEAQPAYRQWEYRQELELRTISGLAPRRVYYRALEDGAEALLRCRKCRRVLADSRSLVDHGGSGCAHRWVEPVEWMQAELAKGAVEGRLACPKCGCKVGSYAWTGMRCSCSAWVVPAISLARGRVDEVRQS